MGIGRLETWSRLGRVQVVIPLADKAYAERIDFEFRTGRSDNQRGDAWHTSIHVSSFPGDSARPCARQLVYKLANFPKTQPVARWVEATGKVGSAVEDDIVDAMGFAGRLLSAPATSEQQTEVYDADHWLTGAPDLIVLPVRWNRPHLVEVKTKYRAVIDEMRAGLRSYDPDHRNQALEYVDLVNRLTQTMWETVVVCKHSWRIAIDEGEGQYVCREHGPGAGCLKAIALEPCRTGSIVYHSRDNPDDRVEFFIELDPEFSAKGMAVLDEAIDAFRAGKIPDHPFGGQEWSKLPCKFCDQKKMSCKPDFQKNVADLEASHGVQHATDVYGEYDFKQAHSAVIARWEGRSGVGGEIIKGGTDTNGGTK